MKIDGKNVLITGASGLIGSNLLKQILARYNCSLTAVHHQQSLSTICTTTSGDLLNPQFCDSITKNQDIVFHCAARSYGAMVMENDPTLLVRDNIIMNINMLEACHKNDVKKFVWLASTTGYPNTAEAVTEDMMFTGEPFDKYYAVGWVKRYTEVLCKLFSEKLSKSLPCIVLRPTNIFGPNDKTDFKKSHVLPALMRKVAENQNPIEVWGDGTDERDVLYVDDMVDAMLIATEKIETFEQINIGYGQTYTVLELLNIIKKVANNNSPYKLIPTGPRMIPIRRVNIDKAKKVMDWTPKITVEEGISRTYGWMVNKLNNI